MPVRMLMLVLVLVLGLAAFKQGYGDYELHRLEGRQEDPNPVKATPLRHIAISPTQPIRFKRVVLDARTFDNGRKPKVIINPDGRGAVVGAQVGPYGFALYRPGKPPALISRTSLNNGDEDAAVADLDGDHAPDIVVGGLDGVTFELHNPVHDGCADVYRCSWPMTVIGRGHNSHDVVIGDVNHNGRPDVVTENGIYFNTKGGWKFVGRATVPRDGEGTELAQLVGDGIPDIIAPYKAGTELARFVNPLHHGGDPMRDPWAIQVIDANPPFKGNMTTAIADVNGDGRKDIVAAPMYGGGGLVWYEAPARPGGTWRRHSIDATVNYVHQNSLQIADVSSNGRLDIAFAEQDQSPTRRIGVFYNLDGGQHWRLQVLSTVGGQNIKIGRLGNDGPLAIVSARHGAFGGPNPLLEFREVGG